MKHNFNPGPAILDREVLLRASKAVMDLDGTGLSVLEISHRSKEFKAIISKACELVLEISKLKDKGYKILFLHGGASMQFLNVAANFLHRKAGYINTGSWSAKALKEAKNYGEVIEVASSAYNNYIYIPRRYDVDNDLDYLHITTNNTIYGTEYGQLPNVNCPLVADMSSDIFSDQRDYSKFDLFYAGAQKNLGPAGVGIVVVKESFLETITRNLPSMINYKVHAEKESMFNTPPVFAVYTTMLNLQWIIDQGGLKKISKRNVTKASLLYAEIDRNSKFRGFVNKEDRSKMNVTFNLVDKNEKETFDSIWQKAGIVGLNGHRSVGGYRASLYNALKVDSVELLVDCMKKFENR